MYTEESLAGLARYRQKQRLRKCQRLVNYCHVSPSLKKQTLWKDERLMDIDDVEAYIEATLAIETDDITERTKAVGPALKLIELKEKLHGEQNPLLEDEDA